MAAPRTLFDRIWQSHVVVDRGDGYHLLYVDRHLMHDGSGPGFAGLRERGLKVRRPELALATPDHYTSTAARTLEAIPDPHRITALFEEALEELDRLASAGAMTGG